MFAFEWTQKNYDRDGAAERAGIAAALTYCAEYEIDPATAFQEYVANEGESATWTAIEWVAYQAAFDGWGTPPENVSLVWN